MLFTEGSVKLRLNRRLGEIESPVRGMHLKSAKSGTHFSILNLLWVEFYRNKIKLVLFCIYHSVQNLLSSRLLSKNIKIRIYRTIILPVVLYGCETWSLTLREEYRLRVFENRVLRRNLDRREMKWREIGGNCIMRSFITCTPNQT
jgi:hypothetical protein